MRAQTELARVRFGERDVVMLPIRELTYVAKRYEVALLWERRGEQ